VPDSPAAYPRGAREGDDAELVLLSEHEREVGTLRAPLKLLSLSLRSGGDSGPAPEIARRG